MGYLNNQEKTKCFGCGACAQECNMSAINMKQDSEGFLYPCIDEELCIRCGRCVAVCPAEQPVNSRIPKRAFAAKHCIGEIREASSSGGAFGAVLECTCDEDDIIYGAEWKTTTAVKHDGAPAKEAFVRFKKSKYVQSVIGDSYKEIKQLLQDGKRVVFTGTPCQIAGLKTFLGKEPDGLLCIDLICHGVSSSKVLERYLQCQKRRHHDEIQRIEFRHKRKRNGKWQSKLALLQYASGREQVVDYDSSAFLRGYDNGLFFRPSCGECPFASAQRVSDLTIGDYWGCEKQHPNWNVHEGVSLILTNTDKGLRVVDDIKKRMTLVGTDLEYAIAQNARLNKPDRGHAKRSEFFARLDNEKFDCLVSSYIPAIPRWKKIAYKIKKCCWR